MTGASGTANSSQLLERNVSVEKFCSFSKSRAKGCTYPFGMLPALKALNRPTPARARTASAMILPAELLVQRNTTFFMKTTHALMNGLNNSAL
jgi:hypothetical protein